MRCLHYPSCTLLLVASVAWAWGRDVRPRTHYSLPCALLLPSAPFAVCLWLAFHHQLLRWTFALWLNTCQCRSLPTPDETICVGSRDGQIGRAAEITSGIQCKTRAIDTGYCSLFYCTLWARRRAVLVRCYLCLLPASSLFSERGNDMPNLWLSSFV